MTRILEDIAARYPTKSALYKIGQTEGGITKLKIFIDFYLNLFPQVEHYGLLH